MSKLYISPSNDLTGAKKRENRGEKSKNKQLKKEKKNAKEVGSKKTQIAGEHRGFFFDPFGTVKEKKRGEKRGR